VNAVAGVEAATVGDAITAATLRLSRAGVAAPRLDARILIGHALGLDAAAVFGRPERPLDGAERRSIEGLVARRGRGESVALITGEREFWSLPIRVTADVLVPRPETETLVEAAYDWLETRTNTRPRVLDLGTGSGCLLRAILSERADATGLGVDASAGALAVARENARALGLGGRARFRRSDWGEGLDGTYHLIVCNPPYLSEADLAAAPAEVAREPRLALAGGADGLEAYRRLAPGIRRLLAPDGAVFVEIGQGQAPGVAAILATSGLQVVEVKDDLAGIPRCLSARAELSQDIGKKGVGMRRHPD
jgi:release factor glutamine methyltransferase